MIYCEILAQFSLVKDRLALLMCDYYLRAASDRLYTVLNPIQGQSTHTTCIYNLPQNALHSPSYL